MRSALEPRRGGEQEHSRPVDSLVIWLNPRDSSLISTTGSVRKPNDLVEENRRSPPTSLVRFLFWFGDPGTHTAAGRRVKKSVRCPWNSSQSLPTLVTGHGLRYPVEISENSGKMIGRANITGASSVSTGEERGNEENQAGVPWGVSRQFSLLAGVNRHVRVLVSRSIWSGARAEFLRFGGRSPSPRLLATLTPGARSS